MATPTQNDILAAIVAKVSSAAAGAKVYDRVRYPERGRDSEYAELLTDADGNINSWFIEWVGYTPRTTEMDDLVEEVYTYRLLGHRGVVDNEDSSQASRTLFSNDISAIINALKADKTLALGVEVSHSGLRVQGEITAGLLGEHQCHICDARLVVVVQQC
ncbi:MAG: hypothetical protein AB1631_29785 [Acidobacteriota bacterium]